MALDAPFHSQNVNGAYFGLVQHLRMTRGTASTSNLIFQHQFKLLSFEKDRNVEKCRDIFGTVMGLSVDSPSSYEAPKPRNRFTRIFHLTLATELQKYRIIDVKLGDCFEQKAFRAVSSERAEAEPAS